MIPTGLLPAHVVSRARAGHSGGWLIDPFGIPHALVDQRSLIGREPSAELAIHNASVSREHGEVRKVADVWQLRDLGSRNGTFVDALRLNGRKALTDGACVRFGDVGFVFVERATMPTPEAAAIETGHAGAGIERYLVVGDDLELCLVGSNTVDDESGMGVLLHRRRGAAAWSELDLPRLEHQLMQLLCRHAIEEAGSVAQVRGTVTTKMLARNLKFRARYPSEENVRQVVKRLRDSLGPIGAGEALGSIQGRGYYIAWRVQVG